MLEFINDYIEAAVSAYQFNGFAVIPFILVPIIIGLPIVYGLVYLGSIKSVKH